MSIPIVDEKGQPLPNVPWAEVFEERVDEMLKALVAAVDDETKPAEVRARAQAELEFTHKRINEIPKDVPEGQPPNWRSAQLWDIEWDWSRQQTPARPSTTVTYLPVKPSAKFVAVDLEPVDDAPTFE
jgi:hypothetical protein